MKYFLTVYQKTLRITITCMFIDLQIVLEYIWNKNFVIPVT